MDGRARAFADREVALAVGGETDRFALPFGDGGRGARIDTERGGERRPGRAHVREHPAVGAHEHRGAVGSDVGTGDDRAGKQTGTPGIVGRNRERCDLLERDVGAVGELTLGRAEHRADSARVLLVDDEEVTAQRIDDQRLGVDGVIGVSQRDGRDTGERPTGSVGGVHRFGDAVDDDRIARRRVVADVAEVEVARVGLRPRADRNVFPVDVGRTVERVRAQGRAVGCDQTDRRRTTRVVVHPEIRLVHPAGDDAGHLVELTVLHRRRGIRRRDVARADRARLHLGERGVTAAVASGVVDRSSGGRRAVGRARFAGRHRDPDQSADHAGRARGHVEVVDADEIGRGLAATREDGGAVALDPGDRPACRCRIVGRVARALAHREGADAVAGGDPRRADRA